MNIKETLKILCGAPGVAGNEKAASEAALRLLREYIPNAEIDRFNSVAGSIIHDEELPLLLLDAHIDEIGMVVSFIDEKGFLKVGKAGGVDRRALPAAPVTVWGAKPVKGVICALPPHVEKDEGKALKDEDISIDCGFTGADFLSAQKQAEKFVSPGDSVTLDAEFTELQNSRVSARALDDRTGVCAILYALELLKGARLKYNIAVTFSSQEELGLRGAAIAAYNVNPDLAIAVDVSYGDYPGAKENKTGKLGGGVMIGSAPVLDRAMFEQMKSLAESKNIPHQIEVMGGKTSTDADIISLTRGGVRCALLSIPLRNMHTPAETCALSDIENTARLIAEFVRCEDD